MTPNGYPLALPYKKPGNHAFLYDCRAFLLFAQGFFCGLFHTLCAVGMEAAEEIRCLHAFLA